MLNIAICHDKSTDAERINKLVLAWASSRQEERRIQRFTLAYLLSHVCHFHLADGRELQSQYLRTGFYSFTQPLLERV